MSFEARSNELLTATIYGAHKSEDLDEALERLSGQLRSYYDLWHVTLIAFLGPEKVRIVGLWTMGEREIIDVGVEVAAKLTPQTEAMAKHILEGRAAVVNAADIDWGLLSDFYARNSIHSVLAVPVWLGPTLGALGLASSKPNAFNAEDAAFMSGVAAGLSQRLGALVEASGRLA